MSTPKPMPPLPSEPLSRVLEVLDRLEIPWLIGGSVASSAHGIPRTTLDIDLVVDFPPERIDDFVAELSREFYADAALIRESFARGRAANIIHLGSGWKFDLFPLLTDEYSRVAFSRRVYRAVRGVGGEPIECAVSSAEDTVLRKLDWYRAGSQTSERQWNDLLGVCRTVGAKLDIPYLRRWATFLRLSDLLEALLAESATSTPARPTPDAIE